MNSEPRQLRCRVKDLVASCFNTCRLPLEEDEAGISGSKPQPKTSNRSDVRVHEATMKMSKKIISVETCSHKTGGGGGRAAEVEPRFAEEDYIVFCFGEDGEIHMINNERESSEIQPSCSINTRKMKNDVDELPNANASKMDSSFESCDSSLSDTSTASFAFPVLGMDWLGSPLHMPNAEKCNGDACRSCCTF